MALFKILRKENIFQIYNEDSRKVPYDIQQRPPFVAKQNDEHFSLKLIILIN